MKEFLVDDREFRTPRYRRDASRLLRFAVEPVGDAWSVVDTQAPADSPRRQRTGFTTEADAAAERDRLEHRFG